MLKNISAVLLSISCVGLIGIVIAGELGFYDYTLNLDSILAGTGLMSLVVYMISTYILEYETQEAL